MVCLSTNCAAANTSLVFVASVPGTTRADGPSLPCDEDQPVTSGSSSGKVAQNETHASDPKIPTRK